MEKLYWKIYGIGHITNNELYAWMIKGWIAENKGNVVNWAEGIVAIVQKKTLHVRLGSLLRAPGEKLDCNDGSKQQSSVGMSFPQGFFH